MIHLLNSAVMPQAGLYNLQEISQQEFVQHLRNNSTTFKNLKSYIGYVETLDIIESISGIRPEMSREKTFLTPGDILLIIKLKYRVQNPAEKGKVKPSLSDFEFFICFYTKE